MEQDFYRGRLQERSGVEVIIPPPHDRCEVHRVIYDELCHGEIELSLRQSYQSIMMDLVTRGAEGVILGCTEIPSLVKPEDVPVPLFDTTRLHAEAAVARALS